MKEMILKVAPFVFKQTVYIVDRETNEVQEEQIPQKDLANYISLHENEIDCVHLFGNEKFVRKIEQDCTCKYNVCKCNFKINE